MFSLLATMVLLAVGSEIKSDEEVVFFPTAAWYDEESDLWNVPIHGWIFEPERDSWRREKVFEVLGASFEPDQDVAGEKLFRQRGAWLLVDNERGKQIQILLGTKIYEMPASAENGHFQTTLHMSADEAAALGVTRKQDCSVEYTAITQANDQRTFSGQIHFLSPTGTSVVSDIDDTIKISEVLDKKKLLRNTFLEPFAATPGMSKAFQTLSRRGNAFHYVSASPWQLFPELYAFTNVTGYPLGSWHLKSFRALDRSAFNLLADPVAYKLAAIEPILKAWPERKFVLIGDTGERDPEVYGELARRFPQQIQKIWLRNVTSETVHAPRFASAMGDVSLGTWRLFTDGAEIEK